MWLSYIMGGKAFIIMVLSGLCTLPSCFPRQYHLVEQYMSWTDAQSYCRQHYTDMATIHSEDDVSKLPGLLGVHNQGIVWIGLYNDINSWRWSLENESYYGEGEADFRMWGSDGLSYHNDETCIMFRNGTWWDSPCNSKYSFVCYNARGPSRFIFVTKNKTWTEAQSYCRERYTDLASVRNTSENEEIHFLAGSVTHVWIGLYRDSWKWSDGSTMSFTNWQTPREPDGQNTETCVAVTYGKWYTWPCGRWFYFICYSGAVVKRQVVRLKLKVSDSSVDPEQMKEAMLQQLHQRLKDQGLSEDVKLRWVTQPDGKIFHKEEKEEEEESCKNEEDSCGVK